MASEDEAALRAGDPDDARMALRRLGAFPLWLRAVPGETPAAAHA